VSGCFHRLPPTMKKHRIVTTMSANVTRPAHYTRWKMEPITFIEANELPFWMGNVIKYIMRADAKNGLEDLYKAKRYLEIHIEHLETGELKSLTEGKS